MSLLLDSNSSEEHEYSRIFPCPNPSKIWGVKQEDHMLWLNSQHLKINIDLQHLANVCITVVLELILN